MQIYTYSLQNNKKNEKKVKFFKDMKKILLTWMALASILYAQIGLGRGLEGIRVPTAKTLGEGYLFMSATYETVSDGRALSMNGYSTPDGTVTLIDNDAPSSGGGISVGFGLSDILEIGLSLPFYYDGEITGTDLDGFGAGDLQAYFKYSYPLELAPVTLAFSGELFVPTGAKDIGFRPRHQWYIHDDKKSYAYSAKNGPWQDPESFPSPFRTSSTGTLSLASST